MTLVCCRKYALLRIVKAFLLTLVLAAPAGAAGLTGQEVIFPEFVGWKAAQAKIKTYPKDKRKFKAVQVYHRDDKEFTVLYRSGKSARSFIRIAGIMKKSPGFEELKLQGYPALFVQEPGKPFNIFIVFSCKAPRAVAVITGARMTKDTALAMIGSMDLPGIHKLLLSY